MKKFMLMLLALIGLWTSASADTISGDGFQVQFTPPEGWFSSAAYSQSELEALLGLPEGLLAARSEPAGTVWLYYPVDGAYALDFAIQISIRPMESYHQNYSGFGETQLDNIAKSFMKDGTVVDYGTVKTGAGLSFLRLSYAEDAKGQYCCFYTTNENGCILRAEIPGTVAEEPALTQWLESIVIRPGGNSVLNLLSEYWYMVLIAAVAVVGVCKKQKRAQKS